MVCPVCITSAVTAHIPVISAAVSGLTAAKIMAQKQPRKVEPVPIPVRVRVEKPSKPE
jgi:hypothetical protein